MAGQRVIIIGAGLAGLSAGCYAQLNGYQSHIFEHHAKPGGVAAAWKRNGYTIDGGIHFIMGNKPGTALHELYQELGADVAPSVDMTTYGRFVDEASGRSTEVTQDVERLANEWRALSPPDAKVIDEFISGARAMRGIGMSGLGTSKPPELLSPLDRLQEMWQVRGLLRYFSGKYARPVADYALAMRDPWLRECISNLFEPESPVWFVFMLLGLLADGQAIKGIFVRIFNYSSQFAPPGKTVLQAGFETEWDYWDNLQRDDRDRYNAEKERIAGDVLERLEAHYPGISSQVEVTDVATPYTTWRYTLNHKGAWGGWLPTAELLTKRVERTLPGLSNFYMAGQWVTPGGGVPPCLYSGRHVAQLLCRQDKRRFLTPAA